MKRLRATLYLIVITALGFCGLYLAYDARAELVYEQNRPICIMENQRRYQAAGIDCGRIDGLCGAKYQAASDQIKPEYFNQLASKYMTETGAPE